MLISMRKSTPAKRKGLAPKAEPALSLKPRERHFILEYLIDLHPGHAAERAGYSPGGASEAGKRMLADPRIASVIEARIREREAKLEITQDMVLRELATIAFHDPQAMFDEDGAPIPLHKMPEAVRRAIAGLERVEIFTGRGEDRKAVGHVAKIKISSKLEALQLLMRHLGMLNDKVAVTVTTRYEDLVNAANAPELPGPVATPEVLDAVVIQ